MKASPITVLGVLCIVFALALAALWSGAGGRWEPPAAVLPDLAVPEAEKTAAVAADHYQAILDRPLFAPSRRPPPAAAVADETGGQPAPDPFRDVRLYGLFDSGQTGGAIVSIGGAKPKRVHFGEKIGDWTLRSINARELVLSRGDNNGTGAETRTLRLAWAVSSQKPSAPAPESPASAAPAQGAAAQSAAAQAAAAAQTSAPAAPASAPPAALTPQQRIEEIARERLIQRNKLRAEHGLPPISQ